LLISANRFDDINQLAEMSQSEKDRDDRLANNPFCSADIKEFVCGLTATLIYLVFAVFFFNMLLICDSLNS